MPYAHAGRPTSYKPEYCQLLIDHMTKGLSFASFGGVVGVTERTLYDWKEGHPEWVEAENLGKAASMLFWEELGIKGTIAGRDFNSRSWIYNMSNRFKWRERQDVTSDDEKIEGVVIYKPEKNKE